MATALLVGGNTIADTIPLVLDATVEVSVKFSNTVTKHPIETGSTITDHVFKQNTTITIQGLVTNASIGNRYQDDYRENRLQTVYDVIGSLFENREFVTISHQYQTFENCIITSLDIPQSATTGRALVINMTLEQIQVVSSAFVAVSAEIADAAARKQNKGQKTGVDSGNPNNSTTDAEKLKRSERSFEDFRKANPTISEFLGSDAPVTEGSIP